VPTATSGTIDMPLGKRSTIEAGWRMVPDPTGKPARTGWTVLAVADGRALLELRPETGRTHQLRVHAASGIGHAITGDPYYGTAHAGGMMLHASDLSIARGAKSAIAAHAPFPARFAALGFADPDCI
jgi:tRNA pseudouridine32 synthase/23S rRNA pseudouridine746 synthase